MESIEVGRNPIVTPTFDTDTPDVSVTYYRNSGRTVCRRWFSGSRPLLEFPDPLHPRGHGVLVWWSLSAVAGYTVFLYKGQKLKLLYQALGSVAVASELVVVVDPPGIVDRLGEAGGYFSYDFHSASGPILWFLNTIDGIAIRLDAATARASAFYAGTSDARCVSHEGSRFYQLDAFNRQLIVSIGGVPLLRFSEITNPTNVVVDLLGRTIMGDMHPSNSGLYAFDSSTGERLGALPMTERWRESPMHLAYQADLHLFAYISDAHAHLLPGWTWLPVPWTLARARCCSPAVRAAVLACTLVRSLCDDLVFSLLPNELLFMIFELL